MMNMATPRIVNTWDEFNPVVYDGEEAISTRALERKYRTMEAALNKIVNSDNHYTAEGLQKIAGDALSAL